MNQKFALIGGDSRNVFLAEMLANDGYQISTFGFENSLEINENKKIIKHKNFKDAIDSSDIIIGPIPLSNKENVLNNIYGKTKYTIENILQYIKKDKLLIAGNIKEKEYEIISNNNAKAIDILKIEKLAVLNAISTAEGAIALLIKESNFNLNGSNILIFGFGRIGKILCKILVGFGANIYCSTNNDVELAWIKAYGYNGIEIDKIDLHLNQFNVIINTIPAIIIDSHNIKYIKKDCLIIDLASYPGGIEKIAIQDKNIKFIWALGLPGKISPKTSAEYIKDTIYEILKITKE